MYLPTNAWTKELPRSKADLEQKEKGPTQGPDKRFAAHTATRRLKSKKGRAPQGHRGPKTKDPAQPSPASSRFAIGFLLLLANLRVQHAWKSSVNCSSNVFRFSGQLHTPCQWQGQQTFRQKGGSPACLAEFIPLNSGANLSGHPPWPFCLHLLRPLLKIICIPFS